MTKGQKIRRLLDLSGMSRTEFADKLGTTKQTVYKYENDIVTNIPSDRIERICRIFNVSPAYLMGWEDTPEGTAAHAGSPSPGEDALLVTDPEEKHLIKTYQKLDEYGKRAVQRTLSGEEERCLATAPPEEKEGSLPA